MAQTQIKNPGPHPVSASTMTLFMVLAGVGVAAFLAGLMIDTQRTWASFVMNHFYFMSLALGGLFFAVIQWLTGAMWSAPIRRMSEALTAYLPIALLTFIILFFGMKHIYSWTHASHVNGDLILEGKKSYLNMPFFVIRNIIALGLWWLFAKKMVGQSLAQDQTKSPEHTASNRRWSPIFLIIFALTFTMASIDILMSLDPHWFSTMFGVYCFAGLFYSTLAMVCLLTLSLKKAGTLEGIVNDNHIHDLGKFMFAFTVFWAYIGFCQFMLIWYANLPEETGYFMNRFQGGWLYVSIFLLVGKFMVPFFTLLPRDAKRNPSILKFVAGFMLLAQWIDILWITQPEFSASGPKVGWVEVGVTLGFVGLFGFMVARFLSKNNAVAIGDPKLAQSMHHHV